MTFATDTVGATLVLWEQIWGRLISGVVSTRFHKTVRYRKNLNSRTHAGTLELPLLVRSGTFFFLS